jgi:hypothetical protein
MIRDRASAPILVTAVAVRDPFAARGISFTEELELVLGD